MVLCAIRTKAFAAGAIIMRATVSQLNRTTNGGGDDDKNKLLYYFSSNLFDFLAMSSFSHGARCHKLINKSSAEAH